MASQRNRGPGRGASCARRQARPLFGTHQQREVSR